MSAVLTPRSAARARSICTRSSGLSSTSVLSRSVKPPIFSERSLQLVRVAGELLDLRPAQDRS
jgi:hypothetical protein